MPSYRPSSPPGGEEWSTSTATLSMSLPRLSGMASRASATSASKRSGATSSTGAVLAQLRGDGARRAQRRAVRPRRRVLVARAPFGLGQEVGQEAGERKFLLAHPQVAGQRAGDGVDLVDVDAVAVGQEVD